MYLKCKDFIEIRVVYFINVNVNRPWLFNNEVDLVIEIVIRILIDKRVVIIMISILIFYVVE